MVFRTASVPLAHAHEPVQRQIAAISLSHTRALSAYWRLSFPVCAN